MNEQRDEYVKKLKAKMDKWNAEIDKLKAKVNQAETETKIEYSELLTQLKKKQKELEIKITDIQKAGADSWKDLKTGVDKARDSMKEAVNSVVASVMSYV